MNAADPALSAVVGAAVCPSPVEEALKNALLAVWAKDYGSVREATRLASPRSIESC
jgi:hypothetical protein